MENTTNASMIATIRRQLEQEEEALRRLKEPASGTARHDFINAKMQRFDALREELIPLVGEQQATATVYEHYERAVNEQEPPAKARAKTKRK